MTISAASIFALCVSLGPYLAAGLAQQHQILQVGERVPLNIVNRVHEVCYPAATMTTSLKDFDYSQNGTRSITVIGHYYSGCTPGREDSPVFALLAQKYYTLRRPVAFMETLKNGINHEICEDWANLAGGGVYVSNNTMPYIVNDEHRALAYAFFEGPFHPQYVILDHCMMVRHRLNQLSNTTLIETLIDALVAEINTDCPARPSDDVVMPGKCYKVHIGHPDEPEECKMWRNDSAVTSATCAPVFGTVRAIHQVANESNGIAFPRDLQVHPLTGDLWVANNHTDGVTILKHFDPNDSAPLEFQYKADRAFYHYMDRISSLSFGRDGWFATCQESSNNYENMKTPNYFMGPSLFETVQTEGTPPINVDASGRGCGDAGPYSDADHSETCFFTHSDMLHSAPLCVGIAHDPEDDTPLSHVYWAFDGQNETLMRFDFEAPHYPGSLVHDLANVRRFNEINLTRVPGVVGHIVVDKRPHTVYVADTGGNRVLAVDADSGRFDEHARIDLGGEYEIWSSNQSSFEYSVYGCAHWTELKTGVPHPSGLALHGNVLYVASYQTGEIHALHKTTGEVIQTLATGAQGIMGLTIDAEATPPKLYYVDAPTHTVHAVVVETACGSEDMLHGEAVPSIAYDMGMTCPTPRRTLLGEAVHLPHEDGYLNMTMLGPSYGESDDCMACNANCDNDMLLMSGYLCHVCLPNPCSHDQPCSNLIGAGYTCDCSEEYSGDHCQHMASTQTPPMHNASHPPPHSLPHPPSNDSHHPPAHSPPVPALVATSSASCATVAMTLLLCCMLVVMPGVSM